MLFKSTTLGKRQIFTLVIYGLIVNVQGKINDGKIIGGRKASKSEGLFMASFQKIVDSMHICGASLYSPSYLLTSCKCISENFTSPENRVAPLPADQYQVSAGSKYNYAKEKSYVTMKVESLYQHPECVIDLVTGIWINNLGIIHVEKPFQEGESIQFIPYPSTVPDYTFLRYEIFGKSNYWYQEDKTCFVFGWGCVRFSKDNLCTGEKISLELRQLQLINPEQCQEMLCEINSNICKFWPHINNAFCAYVHLGFGSLCRGDGGSPFVCNNVLVGVASWNYDCSKNILVNIINDLDIDFMNPTKSSAFGLYPMYSLCLLMVWVVLPLNSKY